MDCGLGGVASAGASDRCGCDGGTAMSHETEFVRKWKHDGNATMIQAVQIIATLTAERDALRTALELSLIHI